MVMEKKNDPPVIWRTTYERLKRKTRIRFVLTHIFYLIVIAFLGFFIMNAGKTKEVFILENQGLHELKTKETVYAILRNRGISLSQGLDIAEVTIRQSKKLDLPLSLILAVMKKESYFTPYALSSQNAMGLMQVHPITWEEYIAKLNLKVSNHAAFDPTTNIIVATHILKDLYEFYRKTIKSEEEVWKSVLSSYFAGKTSFSQTGMTDSHLKYVADINIFKKEFDEKFQD